MEGEGQEDTARAREGQVLGHQEAQVQSHKGKSDDRGDQEVREGVEENLEVERKEEETGATNQVEHLLEEVVGRA